MADDAPAALLLGEALVDHLPSGPVAAGAPLNVARHLRQLGLAPLLVSRIHAQDEGGRLIEAAMQADGLRLDGLQRDPARPTGRVDVLLQPDGSHRFHIHEDAAWDHLSAAAARPLLRALQPGLVYFGTLAQRAPASRAALAALLAECSGLRFLDLNLRDGVAELPALVANSLQQAQWVKLNDEELARLGRWYGFAADDAPALMAAFGLRRCLLTRGAAGYAAWGDGGQLLAEGPGVALPRFVDTVGAGDAFSAFVIAACLRGRDFIASLSVANAFAAAICGETGAAPADAAAFYPPWRAQLAALPKERG